MKSRMLISLLVIALVAAVIGGGTMAWFTAKDEAPEVTFTAGTVMVEADYKGGVEIEIENVNPGDCICVGWEFENTGTKKIMLRFAADMLGWVPDQDWLKENWEALCFTLVPDRNFEDGDGFWDWFVGQYYDEDKDVWDLGEIVSIYLCPNQDWKKNADGYYYYRGEALENGDTATLCVCVKFDGPDMDNKFQGAGFKLGGLVEAIQSSNNAPFAEWEVDYADGGQWVDEDFDFSGCKGLDGAPCCQEQEENR